MPSSACDWSSDVCSSDRSEEHTSELQSRSDLVCRLLLEKKKQMSELQPRSDLVCRLLLEQKGEDDEGPRHAPPRERPVQEEGENQPEGQPAPHVQETDG